MLKRMHNRILLIYFMHYLKSNLKINTSGTYKINAEMNAKFNTFSIFFASS